MSLQKLDGQTSLTDRVFEAIRASIMNGDMPAGHRLRIRDLADQVGTSVMPVREAIRRLEEAGLAERQPNRGAVVKGLTLTELAQVYEVRTLLEVEAARLGAAAITADSVEVMATEYDLMRRAIREGRAIAMLDHDEALLATLYRAAGNAVLVDTIRTLWERCRPYKIIGAQATLAAADQSPLWAYQERLLHSARTHDADAAATANTDSLGNATTRIRDQLAAETTRAVSAILSDGSADRTSRSPV